VGDKEVDSKTVTVRLRTGEDLGSMTVEAFSKLLADDVARKGQVVTES
jgi:threonyl-tRNA synthetase